MRHRHLPAKFTLYPAMLMASAAVVLTPLADIANADSPAPSKEPAMQKVTGIGGLFFRAKDPAGTAQWYADNLGIDKVPTDYDTPAWEQQAGTTVFAPFPAESDYFGAADQQWMVNFRVDDLDAMVAQLRGNGISVEVDPEEYPNGRFARLSDPEGTPIQLWEPKEPPKN